MTEKETIGYFSDKFEDIEMHFHKIETRFIKEVNKDDFFESSPYVNIWPDMGVTDMPQSKNLIGGIIMIMRSQNEKCPLSLLLDIKCVVRAAGDTKAASTFTKLVQYLFDWVKKYVNDKGMSKGEDKFILPHFHYSAGHFEKIFPQ